MPFSNYRISDKIMARFRASFGRILTIGGLAAATSSAVVYHSHLTERACSQNLDNSQAVDEASKKPKTKWDNDWDRRSSFIDLTKAIRRNEIDQAENARNKAENCTEKASDNGNEDGENKKRSKATRHLIFVRHGQYNSSKKVDEEKRLTDLGRLACFLILTQLE